MKKIGVFVGDLFWSSIPYECLDVFHAINKEFDCDLMMFEQDIRLNKVFDGSEKYHFDPQLYRECQNLRLISSWEDLYLASVDYELVVCSSKIAPKTRFPHDMRQSMRCPVVAWDVGGADVLTDAVQVADTILTKGDAWSQWLAKMGHPQEFAPVGTPHYDPFLPDYAGMHALCTEEEFSERYGLNVDAIKVLVAPSNPKSHRAQYNENIGCIAALLSHQASVPIELLVKTYPHDYMYNEAEGLGTGVYRRPVTNGPQYESLQSAFPSLVILESQDHFNALKYCDYLFNISGSHVSWETYFTQCQSFSMNFSKQEYFGGVKYLPDYVVYPDSAMNTELDEINQLFVQKIENDKSSCEKYFTKELFSDKINFVLAALVH